MPLALLFHYLMLNMFRMLVHLSSGACELFVELFHGLYCSGTMCVGVTLWFGWGGVVSVCTSVPPRNHQNNWHFSRRQAVWPTDLHRLSSGYRLLSHCFINKRHWNVGRLFSEVEIAVRNIRAFYWLEEIHYCQQSCEEIVIGGILEVKSILLPQFLNHWARWRGESRGVLVGPNNEPKFLLWRFRTHHTRISPVRYLISNTLVE